MKYCEYEDFVSSNELKKIALHGAIRRGRKENLGRGPHLKGVGAAYI